MKPAPDSSQAGAGARPSAPAWFAAILAVLLVAGLLLPHGDLLRPSQAAWQELWLVELVTVVLVLAGLAAALAPRLARACQAAARCSWAPRLGRLALPLLALGWFLGWWFWLIALDPEWLGSGNDWHDYTLCAYGLGWGDPYLYHAHRYPLYPALGALLQLLTGLPIERALQVAGRAAAIAIVLPIYGFARPLYGRAAAAAGAALVAVFTAWLAHLDSVSSYSLLALLAVSALAGIVQGIQQRSWGWALAGLGLAGACCTDAKALFLFGLLAVALLAALVLPASMPSTPADPADPTPARSPPTRPGLLRALGARLLRLTLLLAPLVLAYGLMARAPVQVQSLEILAKPIFEERFQDYKAQSSYKGYIFGKYTDLLTPVRTLGEFAAAAKRKASNAESCGSKPLHCLQKRLPGTGPAMLALVLLGLLLPLLRPGRSWRQRVAAALQIAAVAALLASILPGLTSRSHEDRYLLHSLVVLPALFAGALDLLICLAVARGPARALARIAILGAVVLACLHWPGSPFSLRKGLAKPRVLATGCVDEHDLRSWALREMPPDAVILDTSQNMFGLLLASQRATLRPGGAYPPAGAPWPETAWRQSLPWPERISAYYMLVAPAHMNPQIACPASANQVEKSLLAAQAWCGSEEWEQVYLSQGRSLAVYRYLGPGAPPDWRLPQGRVSAELAPTGRGDRRYPDGIPPAEQ